MDLLAQNERKSLMSDNLLFDVSFICNVNGFVRGLVAVPAVVACAALHMFGLFDEEELERCTRNGSTLEREFNGYVIQVERAKGAE